ncbi:MAG: TIGR01244 family sulfur transferase [Pseudomonadota bacterium]
MDIRQITPTYFVAPQLDPSEMPDIAAAGIKTIICNRPDAEVPPSLQADAVEMAARDAGLAFHRLPLTHQTMTPDNVARQMAMAQDAQHPVLAYCASGTRCTVIWCLGQAGKMDCDDILRTARAGGYDLDALRPTIEAIAAQKAG